MPRARLLSALAGVVLLVASPALAAPADAAPASSVAARSAEPLPKRTVTSTVVKRQGKLIMKGTITPEHANRAVYIQRKKCLKCEWRLFEKVTSSDKSAYRVRIYAPKKGAWYFRAKVRAHDGYGTSYSGVWKTYVV